MAGLRQGYAIAHPETIKKMRQWVGSSGTGSLNVFGMAAATASIQQDADGAFSKNERMRNKAVRDMVSKWFNDRGMKPTDAQANFMFVNIGTPGAGVPRRLPRQGRDRRARLPAVREDPRPHLPRHHGGDDQGRAGLRRSAREEVDCGGVTTNTKLNAELAESRSSMRRSSDGLGVLFVRRQ